MNLVLGSDQNLNPECAASKNALMYRLYCYCDMCIFLSIMCIFQEKCTQDVHSYYFDTINYARIYASCFRGGLRLRFQTVSLSERCDYDLTI